MTGDGGFGGQPAAQVVAVGVDQRAAVAGWPLQLLGGGGAGVALDRVQRPAQPAGAFQQAHALAEQLVHGRVPGPGPLVDRPGGPARLRVRASSVLWAMTVFSTAPARPCHRCQRSLTCTASGAPWRMASA